MVGWGGICLSWGFPSREQQKACIASAGGFNYDPKFHGASSSSSYSSSSSCGPEAKEKEKEKALAEKGFFVNRSRVFLGSGDRTFHLAKSALLSWSGGSGDGRGEGHQVLRLREGGGSVGYDASPDRLRRRRRQIRPRQGFLRLRQRHPPRPPPRGRYFKFGHVIFWFHNTLVLKQAGEERFSVERDENGQVWYEIFSFSKPAHILSVIGYPYVRLRQKYFAQQSTQAVLKHVANRRHSES